MTTSHQLVLANGVFVLSLLSACSSSTPASNGAESGATSTSTSTLNATSGRADAMTVATHDATTPAADARQAMQGDTGMPGASDAPIQKEQDTGVTSSIDGGGGLVINEISGKSIDYVELFNTGSTSIDLSGWGVTEAKDSDAGVPGSPKTAAVFPAGSTLAAGAYALALGAPKDGGSTLPGCPASVCVQATWNISNTNGAHIYLLNPASATIFDQSYPAETTVSGDSWGRLPNGTGAFVLNGQTPGAVNTAP